MGTPTSAVITPTGSSSGRATVRATTSARTRNEPAGQKAEGEQRAVQRPCQRANRVGNHQAHEADDAAGGDAGRGEERRADIHQAPDAIHVGTEMVGRLVAQRDEVERARAQSDRRQGYDGVGGEHRERLPRGRAEPAEQPEEGVAHGGCVGEHDDRAHERAGERAHHYAREQQDPGDRAAGRRRG